MRQQESQSGFTLLEVMLAILILGMVMAMLTLSLSGSLRVVEERDDLDALYRRARVSLERISDDLSGAVLTDDGEFVGREVDGAGDEPETLLSFFSSAHVDFGGQRPGHPLARIRYRLVRDPETPHLSLLLRSDEIPAVSGDSPGDPGEDLLLCDRLLAVRFRFLDRTGQELDRWQARPVQPGRSDRNRQLPAAVSCRLEFGDPDEPEAQEPLLTLETTILLPTALFGTRGKDGA